MSGGIGICAEVTRTFAHPVVKLFLPRDSPLLVWLPLDLGRDSVRAAGMEAAQVVRARAGWGRSAGCLLRKAVLYPQHPPSLTADLAAQQSPSGGPRPSKEEKHGLRLTALSSAAWILANRLISCCFGQLRRLWPPLSTRLMEASAGTADKAEMIFANVRRQPVGIS